jgi:hypothetical protein
MKRGRNHHQRRRQGMNVNRALDSNGPDVRIRGTANQIYDKYLALARDANSMGDRVKAENYHQHAEHYYRLIRAMQPQQPVPGAETVDGEEQPQLGGSESYRNGGDGEAQGAVEARPESAERESEGEQPEIGSSGNGAPPQDRSHDEQRRAEGGFGEREGGRRRRRRPRHLRGEGGAPSSSSEAGSDDSEDGDDDSSDVAAE